jgi:DNA-binding beta-propeller fold protein YncE
MCEAFPIFKIKFRREFMRMIRTAVMTAAVLTAALPMLAQAQWKVERTMQVGGQGGWDYVTVDAENHRLFLPRQTHTQVLDENTGKVLGDIPGQKTAHGVAIVPSVGRGFITDGGGQGGIVIFDLKTYAVLGTVVTLPDSDGIAYDEGTNRVLAVAGDSNALISLDPSVDPKHGTFEKIELGGAPEFFAADGAGKVYVNLEDKDVVAVVDLKSKSVEARWPIAPGGKPVGMAMDKANHVLFVGARKPQKMLVMDTTDGKIVAALPIGMGNDAVAFDNGQAFASCADGTLTVVGKEGESYAVEQVLKTAQGARTLGLDSTSHKLYLPTADFESLVGGAKGRPKMKPGTFKVVVVGQQ